MTAESIIIVLLGYLIGSIPFAYLLTKRFGGLDLRREGSRNIGARNAYEVTQKRWIGIVVLVLDLLKGSIPIVLCQIGGHVEFIPFLSGAILLGHCYPIWLKFHGGRGLATGAGIVLVLSPLAVLGWLLFYWFSTKICDNVHVDSVIAIILVVALILVLPASFLSPMKSDFSGLSVITIRESVAVIAAVIVSRHIEPVVQLLRHSSQ
jgi:glycerol-3-phosphate acyltransferase PlsY